MSVQVTNPPIDPLREGLVMSLNMRLGKRGNLLQPGPNSYNQLLLETPVLVESELEAIQSSSGLSSKVLEHSCSDCPPHDSACRTCRTAAIPYWDTCPLEP